MISLTQASSLHDLQDIENLARIIIPEFYKDIVPLDHCYFFVEKFQTVAVLQKQLQEESFTYFLFRNHGRLAGYMGLQHQINADNLLLSKLYFLKEMRGLGMGSQGMTLFLQRAEELKVATASLTVNQDNHRTIRFYERHGFTIERELINQYENGHTVVDLEMKRRMG